MTLRSVVPGGGRGSFSPWPCVEIPSVVQAEPSSPAQSSWWVPPLGSQPWQWELSHPLRLSNARDMGTDDKLPNGQRAPAPVIYDIDGIINPATTVTALHDQGKHVVCYIEVGAAGNYYSAADEGIATTYYDQLQKAGVFGKKVPGYPEYYLDIRAPATVSIIESMIDQQCAAKGFDAVETDIDEEYNDPSGFPLTKAEEESYMTTLADYMHGLGLGLVDQESRRHRRQLRQRHVQPGRCRPDRAVQPVLVLWPPVRLCGQESGLQRRISPEAVAFLFER